MIVVSAWVGSSNPQLDIEKNSIHYGCKAPLLSIAPVLEAPGGDEGACFEIRFKEDD